MNRVQLKNYPKIFQVLEKKDGMMFCAEMNGNSNSTTTTLSFLEHCNEAWTFRNRT